MDFTKKFVKTKRPCADGFRWFIKRSDEGEGYQELLDALVDEGRISDACWLLDQFGPTDAVREVDEVDAVAVVFAGTLKVKGGVRADQLLRVGRELVVGAGVRVGHDREPDVQSGLFAGDDVRIAGGLDAFGEVNVQGHLRTSWGIAVQGPLVCNGDLTAGWGLECDEDVTVDGNLKCGGELQVAQDLHCAKSIQTQGAVDVQGHLRVGQGLLAAQNIHCAMHLDAGWGVISDGSILVGASLRAGESIRAAGEIRTGDGYGIYAGLAVHRDSWETSAQVQAQSRPIRLWSGHWVCDESLAHCATSPTVQSA